MEKLLNEIKALNKDNYIVHYKDFTICKSILFNGGYCVVSCQKHIQEHFSTPERVVNFLKKY